jgi:hypothetical protein
MLALGDMAEQCLRFFGVTKERVQGITGRKDCGCAKRQAAMNEWGYRLQERLFLPIHWLRLAWHRARYGEAGTRIEMACRYMGRAIHVLWYGF